MVIGFRHTWSNLLRRQQPVDKNSLEQAVGALVAEGVEAIAVCFLFSFANLAHERFAAEFIQTRHPHLMVSISSDVDTAFRELEQTEKG
ncbi:MAG: hydantoinase/oxoprolinase N-terminal domain-containing protein [Burkholderiaceae bacterium]